MPPLLLNAPRMATPIPDPAGSIASHAPAPHLRLFLAADGHAKLRRLLSKYRTTGHLRPHLPPAPGFLSLGLLRLLAKKNPALLRVDADCLLVHSARFGQVDCVRYLLGQGCDPNVGFRVYGHYDVETDTLILDDSERCKNDDDEDEEDDEEDKGDEEQEDHNKENQDLTGSRESRRESKLLTDQLLDAYELASPISETSSIYNTWFADSALPSPAVDAFGQSKSMTGFFDAAADTDTDDTQPIANPRSPLFLAVRQGHVALTQLLLEHGADLGRDPLGLLAYDAARHGHWKVLHLLLSRGAEAGLVIPGERTVTEQVIAHYGSADTDNELLFNIFQLLIEWGGCEDPEQALRWCIAYGQLEHIIYLVETVGVTLDCLANQGLRGVHSPDIVAYLIAHGLADHCELMLRDIMAVPATRTLECLILCLEHGARVHAENGRALKEMAIHGAVDMLAWLLSDTGMDLAKYMTELFHLAVTHAQPEVALLLLDHGVQPTTVFPDAETEHAVILMLDSGIANDVDVYVSLDIANAEALIRVRAGLTSVCVTKSDFEGVVQRMDALKESLRLCLPDTHQLSLWWEDTMVTYL